MSILEEKEKKAISKDSEEREIVIEMPNLEEKKLERQIHKEKRLQE